MPQNIADKPYQKFFEIECSDQNLPAIINALNVIWEDEEGKQLIEKANDKYGKIKISQDTSIKKTTADVTNGVIEISDPYSFNYVTTSGEMQPNTMLDTLAHELYHLGDKELGINLLLYNAGRKQFDIDVIIKDKPNTINFLKLCDSIVEGYGTELFTALSDEEKLEYFEKQFHEPQINKTLSEIVSDRIAHGEEILIDNKKYQDYIEKIEKPAIEFANRITKDIQPPRATTYDEYRHEDEQRLKKYLDDPTFFAQKALVCFNAITKYGSSELVIQQLYKETIESLEPLTTTHPTTVINEDRRYHGAIEGILLCDIKQR